MRRILLLVVIVLNLGFFLSAQTVRFGVITDIHPDIMHDATARLQDFLKAAKKEKVDFIIELGDFCMVKEKNQPFVDLWNSFEGDKYHVLGNHDMDNETKANYIKFVGAVDRYYSFDKGDYHFIVMDPNNLKDGDKYTPYAHGNFYVDAKKRAWVDPEQVAWLKEDLKNTDKRCIIFSHQCFENSVSNREEIRAIFEAENARVGYTKVVAALSGHDHTDYQKEINGIAYIQINSASNQWVGSDYQCDTRYTPAINKAHPSLKYVVPYEKALYAMVTLKKHSLRVKGTKSKFVAPTPRDLKIPKSLYAYPLVPWISDFKFSFK